MRTRHIARLILPVACFLGFASCALHPPAPASSSVNGFAPGQSYVSKQRVGLARRGDMLTLVGSPNKDPESVSLGQLPPGTEVSIRRIVSYDSITHGTISYPEGEIRSGPWAGQVVELAQDGLRPKFQAAKP